MEFVVISAPSMFFAGTPRLNPQPISDFRWGVAKKDASGKRVERSFSVKLIGHQALASGIREPSANDQRLITQNESRRRA
jgi:hypothetical protein